jgi:hypothetical protein
MEENAMLLVFFFSAPKFGNKKGTKILLLWDKSYIFFAISLVACHFLCSLPCFLQPALSDGPV